MQPDIVPVFLSLWLGHLVGDFALQTERILEQKRNSSFRGYLKHGAVHYCCALAFLLLFAAVPVLSLRTQSVLAGLIAVHLLSDCGKLVLVHKGKVHDGASTFIVDQVWHTLTVATAAWFIAATGWSDFRTTFLRFQELRSTLLPVLVVYVAVIFGGGYLVRYLTKPLLEGFRKTPGQTMSADNISQLRNAGMYIGWLERFLILTALVLQSPATVGLILTAKAVIRFPELKDIRFAEYFLIGTLLSMSVALIGGLILIKTLYGTLSLK